MKRRMREIYVKSSDPFERGYQHGAQVTRAQAGQKCPAFFILRGGKDDGNLRHDPLQTHSPALPRLSAGAVASACLQPFAGLQGLPLSPPRFSLLGRGRNLPAEPNE